ncbi:MAG: DUF2069 domain-containing protein [Cocleimonas sp.]
MAALGILGLIILIVIWNSWLTPIQEYPRSVEILFFAGPLLFFIRGILHARRYSMVIITMVSFAYILMGVWYILSVDEKVYGYLLLALSFLMFLGSLMYVWVIDKQEKLDHPERFKKKKKR